MLCEFHFNKNNKKSYLASIAPIAQVATEAERRGA